MATGVLVVGVGKATRLLGRLAASDKTYQATIRLGRSTVTDDAEGDVVAVVDASAVSDAALAAAVADLTGDIAQVPSAVSAIKVDGRRAYRRVRAGEDVVLAARPVTVSRFEVRAVDRRGEVVDVEVEVECTTGTYIRALARDLGSALGVGGHLTSLRRTRVGGYDVDQAHTLDELERDLAVVPLAEAAATSFPTYLLSPDEARDVGFGRALTADLRAEGPVALFTEGGEFMALYEQHGPLAKAIAVFTG